MMDSNPVSNNNTKSKKNSDTDNRREDGESPIKKPKRNKQSRQDYSGTGTTKDKSSILNNKKKKVSWAKNYIEIINVASLKKYTLQNCCEEPRQDGKEKTRCTCVIF